MKNILLILLLSLCTFCAKAQLPGNFNLVANGDFSINPSYIFIDTIFSNSACWISAGSLYPTSFSSPLECYIDTASATLTCLPNPLVNGALLRTISGGFSPKYSKTLNKFIDTSLVRRQYGECQLLEPLITNTTYKLTIKIRHLQPSISTWLAMGNSFNYIGALNMVKNIGAYFSINQINEYNNPNRLNYTPQINFTNWSFTKYDTLEIIKLSATYTAQGGEQFITIGNFDYFKDFVLNTTLLSYPTLYDTVQVTDYKQITEVSLVRDTTQPMISLYHFGLPNDTTLCPGTSMTIGGDANFLHYWWNTGDTTQYITINDTGTYWCTVDFGCSTYTDTIHITPPAAIGTQLLPADTGICSLPLTLHLPPDVYNIIWSNSSTADSLVVNTAGTYWVSGFYCANPVTDTVAISVLPSGVQLPDDTSLCVGTVFSIPLSVTQGFDDYLWSSGDTSYHITASDTGTYWVVAHNACGYFRDTMRIIPITPVVPNLPADTLICSASPQLSLAAPAGVSNILWSNGQTGSTITIDSPGVYWFVADSYCGLVTDTTVVAFCPPVIQSVAAHTSICVGDCIQYLATIGQYPESIDWRFEGGSPATYTNANEVAVCYGYVGSFTTTVIATNTGGADTLTKTITVLPRPVGRFTDTALSIRYGSHRLLLPCTDAEQVDWYRDDTLVCENCSSFEPDNKYWRSNYSCVVRNGSCSDTCYYHISVTDIPPGAWVPNAFSPNGDGRNDILKVVSENPNIRILNFSVYNRYGQRVYFAFENRDGWDGTIGGTPAQMGGYYWYLEYTVMGRKENVTYKKKGDVTLVR